MQIKALSIDECQATLRTGSIGRLACICDGRPYIEPISFDYFEGALYGCATAGREVQWMRANPHVCVEVDDVRDRFNWTSVIVEGRYEELPDGSEHEAARAHAIRLLRRRRKWRDPASAALDPARGRSLVLYRIRIEAMRGRMAFESERLETLPRPRRVSGLRRWYARATNLFRRQPALS